jgi:hypothetical protein
MKTVLEGRNFMRGFRLVLGVALLVQGVVAKDMFAIVIGVVFGGMAIAKIGCCGTNSCATNTTRSDKTKTIVYEEVDNKK